MGIEESFVCVEDGVLKYQLPRGPSATFQDAVVRPGKVVETSVVCRGVWHIYFSQIRPGRFAWCVSPDDYAREIAVRDVRITAPATTTHRTKADDDDGRPSAWIRVEGLLTVGADGAVTIG